MYDFNDNTIILGLDTETTGLPNNSLGPCDPLQARVIQLALKMMTIHGRVLGQFSTLIKPSGWKEIHPKAFLAHGITREMCADHGIEASLAFAYFRTFADRADVIVAHNSDFDELMMTLEAAALDGIMPEMPWHCTMKEATPVCKIPPTEAMLRSGRKGYKSENLSEALLKICGREMVGAHDAMNDVNACLDIFTALRTRKAA